MKKWSDVFNEFIESTGISRDVIGDYRPAERTYVGFDIPAVAIIVWLKDGNEIIYIPKEMKNKTEKSIMDEAIDTAYKRGFQDGVDKENSRIMDILNKEVMKK